MAITGHTEWTYTPADRLWPTSSKTTSLALNRGYLSAPVSLSVSQILQLLFPFAAFEWSKY